MHCGLVYLQTLGIAQLWNQKTLKQLKAFSWLVAILLDSLTFLPVGSSHIAKLFTFQKVGEKAI